MAEDKLFGKNFNFFVVINWNTKGVKVMKKIPKTDNPFEIPIEIKLRVNVPKRPRIVAEGEVTISAHKAEEMFLKSL